MSEQTNLTPRHREDVDEAAELVRWLVRLRWMAIFGVALASALAAIGVVPGVNIWVTAGAVILGVVTNLFAAEPRILQSPWVEHRYQALLDTGALTLVIWASGGAECPFIAFYTFPILLAALLGDRRGLWTTGLACAAGLAFQLLVIQVPELRVGEWNPAAGFEALLSVFAVTLTVAMAAYFAARLNGVLRIQVEARKEADALVHIAFEGLDAGIEMFSESEVLWQNRRAKNLFGQRVSEPWRCREHGAADFRPQEPNSTHESISNGDSPSRHRILISDRGQLDRVLEMVVLPVPETNRHLAVYLDRTHEDAYQKKLMRTEALASLGRTVQGVAHELNTPLATIQTLGRDLLDAMNETTFPDKVRTDLTDSAEVILAEVGRCSRITHALLGRPKPMTTSKAGEGNLRTALEHAIAVVAPRNRELIQLDLGTNQDAIVPFDPVVQISVNLLQNALDAAPDMRVNVVVSSQQDALIICVRDQGPGLDINAERHLYEPFFTTKPPGQGTGLGLYTSYALAQSLGQTLTVANHKHGGVIATLKIPNQVT